MPDELSQEDQDLLIDAKFGTYFDRWFEKRFGEAFDTRVTEMTKASGSRTRSSSNNTSTTQQSNQQASQQQDPPRQRRSSLFEKALGIG